MSSKGLRLGGGGAGGLGDDDPRLTPGADDRGESIKAPGVANPNWEGMPAPMTIAERLRRLRRYADAVNHANPPDTDDLTAIASVIGSYLNGEIDDLESVDEPLRQVEANPVHRGMWELANTDVPVTRGNNDIDVHELTEIYAAIK